MASCSGNGSRGHHKFTLNVNESYVSNGAENYSNVKWSLVLSPIQAGWDWYYGTAPVGFSVTINGTKVANGGITSYDGSSTVTVASGTLKVPHNDDGSKKISFSFSVWENVSANYLTGSASGSGNITLTNIPRYANITQSLNSKTETTIKINWSSDQTVDRLWYTTNDGYSWNEVDINDSTSGNYTITGLSENTLYNVRTRVRRKDNLLESDSARLQVTTYEYPYCIDSPDFTVGQLLTLTLFNPLSRLVQVSFIGANDETLSTDETALTIVEGYNTERFINKLYESIPNSGASPYKIQVTYEGVTKIRDNNNTYNIDGNECAPNFEDFTYKDNNATVTNVTGNDQVLVKGFSNLEVTIGSANKMVAKNSATPNKYTAIIEGLNASANYSDNDVIINVGSVSNAGVKRLSVTAYDSRYCRTTVEKDITVYDYTKPVVNVEVARLNNFEAQTSLKINGTYDKLTVDNVDKNSIQLVQYRYCESGTTNWSNWVSVNTTLSNGKFTCNEVIVSLDNTKGFNFEIQAIDKLDSNIATGSIDVGEAIFFISSNKKACYINGQKIIMYDTVNKNLNSIKLQDNTLIDSTGILHNEQVLSDLLNNNDLENMNAITGLISTDINRSDLNSFTSGVIAGYGHNLTNSPLSNLNQGHLLSIPRHDAEGFVTQYFSPYPSNDVYVRTCEAGTWSKWVCISDTYSTAERVIGTWIDGKPIYRQVIQTTTPSATNTWTKIGSISNMDTLVNMYGFFLGSDGRKISINHGEPSAEFATTFLNGNIEARTPYSNWLKKTVYITLEYTKTTD